MPTHVWAWFDGGWRPGLMVRWLQVAGEWCAEVAVFDSGGVVLHLVRVENLALVDTVPPVFLDELPASVPEGLDLEP